MYDDSAICEPSADNFEGDVVYHCYGGKYHEEYSIVTTNFELFLAFVMNYCTLRTIECFPLYERSSDLAKRLLQLKILDNDRTSIYDDTRFIINSSDNLIKIESAANALNAINDITCLLKDRA